MPSEELKQLIHQRVEQRNPPSPEVAERLKVLSERMLKTMTEDDDAESLSRRIVEQADKDGDIELLSLFARWAIEVEIVGQLIDEGATYNPDTDTWENAV